LAVFQELMATSLLGHQPESVLLEERIEIVDERYLALSVMEGRPQLLIGRAGGVDIEDRTRQDQSNVKTLTISASTGVAAGDIMRLLGELSVPKAYWGNYTALVGELFRLAVENDAELVEINPLAETAPGGLVAVDARISIDDRALPRHASLFKRLGATSGSSTKESRQAAGVKLNPDGGRVGLIGLGSGMNTTIMDWIADEGSLVKAVVDIDDAISRRQAEEAVRKALSVCETDDDIRVVLINVITCGYVLDDIVQSILSPLREHHEQSHKPILLHLRGNGMSRTPLMLKQAGLANFLSLEKAVTAAVEKARFA
jgi:succinyl-CoA synthetase beta subunit